MLAFESKYEDIRELVLNIVVAFTFATLAVVVIAPLFGYKLDLLVSTFNDIAPPVDETAFPQETFNARSLQGNSWAEMASKVFRR